MKFFRLDLLTLLISLFILSSCKNQDTIGLGVDATNQINGVLVDTSTIVINTVKDDSLIASGITKAPLAYFHDPIFYFITTTIMDKLLLSMAHAII